MNSPEESYVENLINLIHLNEPAILYSIELRYWEGLIYTYTGPILLATNPFQEVKIYEQKTLETYYNYGLKVAKGEIEKPECALVRDKEAAQRKHCRGLSAVVGSNEKGGVVREVDADRLELAEIGDFNMSDLHYFFPELPGSGGTSWRMTLTATEAAAKNWTLCSALPTIREIPRGIFSV